MATETQITHVVLRIPGPWNDAAELAERLPDKWRIENDWLYPPTGPPLGLSLTPPDGMLHDIMRTSLRREAQASELAALDEYQHYAGVVGPGGSLNLARVTLLGGAAVVKAGGCGVFIDNVGLSHGGSDWMELAAHVDDPMAVFYAYFHPVKLGTPSHYVSIGMHVFGHREGSIEVGDDPEGSLKSLEDFLRATVINHRQWSVGDVFRDVRGRPLEIRPANENLAQTTGPEHPMHNPHGRWNLVPQGE